MASSESAYTSEAGLAGRQAELQRLDRLYRSDRAEFLAVYGRRRVGKTFLINQFFRARTTVFELTGIKRAGRSTQLENFATELGDVFGTDKPTPRSWIEAFDQLRRVLARRPKGNRGRRQRIVIFLDELPWLATQRSGCLEALAHFWNRYVSRDKRVILVVCGSSTSWMLKKVVGDQGGLHGRLTDRMRLLPFTLREADELLRARGVRLDHQQVTELYMAFGGVPKYLDLARPGRSAAQIIDETCFTSGGYLVDEFRNLYASLFDRSERHLAVIKALAKTAKGLDTSAVSDASGLSPGGTLTRTLLELEESGFISRVLPWGHLKKGTLFRLSDEYSLFYLRWISKRRSAQRSPHTDYWLKKQSSPSWRSWAGFAFEGICLKHVPELKRALGIAALNTRAQGWAVAPTASEPGVQIDLVIDRDDACINLVEVKFRRAPFRITRDYAAQLASKRRRFISETGTRKTVFMTMLTVHGVVENEHYRTGVTNQVMLAELF